MPIDDRACDSAADHVSHLLVNDTRIIRDIAEILVVATSIEPAHKVCIYVGRSARVQQRTGAHFAYVGRGHVAIVRALENTGRAGVIGSFLRQSCGWYYRQGLGVEIRSRENEGAH